MNNRQMTAGKLYKKTINSSMRSSTSTCNPEAMQSNAAHQSGAVLIISLIMLLLLTVLATSGMQNTSLQEKMAGNLRDKNLAFQAAESALNVAETSLDPPSVLAFTDAGTSGYYSTASTIPTTASATLADNFWTSNPVATSTVSTLGNGVASPKYIIKKLSTACFKASCPLPSDLSQPYEITVRATGGSTNAVVILQSIYTR